MELSVLKYCGYLRILGCIMTGWFYAKATREMKPVVAVIGTWAAIICIYFEKGVLK